LKASLSEYYQQWTGSWARQYANSFTSSDTRNWFDCALIPGTSTCDPAKAGLPTNGDGIVEDSEIGPSSSTTFGVRSDRNPAPDLGGVQNGEYPLGVQQGLLPRVSMSVVSFHRQYGDLVFTDRTLISRSDYTSFQVPMPSFANDSTLAGVLNP